MSTVTERWRSIPGYEGSYEVSDLGKVRSLTRRICRQDGLTRISNAHKVASLVLAAFLGPRPGRMDVSHLNGDRRDDRFENLVYETRKENNDRRFEHGTVVRGSEHYAAKLTEKQVESILCSHEPQASLARKYGVHATSIYNIRKRKIWKHVNV